MKRTIKRAVTFRACIASIASVVFLLFSMTGANAESDTAVSERRIAEYIHWYPAIEQERMRDEWLAEYSPGEFQLSGMVTSKDRTVITPQADVNYGYSWFNVSNEPVVITMPEYDKYYSLSVFDMNHFMEVFVMPEKPVVVRLASQKSPIEDAHEIVLQTYQGLVFTRQVVVDNEAEVLKLAEEIAISGGGGNKPFIVPSFTDAEAAAGNKIIQEYALKVPNARKLFGSTNEGVGDLDRAAGVFLGQLGTQAWTVDYAQYVADQNGEALTGEASYQIVVPAGLPLIADDKGYWSLTIYSMEDRYLIPNDKGRYVISSYKAKKNKDGSITINMNPDGKGTNALPTAGQPFYGVFRVYQPIDDIQFPELTKVN